VLVIDENPFVRFGLSAILREAGLDVVGEAAGGRAAVATARKLHPDVVLLNLAEEQWGGAEPVRLVAAAAPEARVVVRTAAADEPQVLGALTAGALGVVLASAPPHEVVAAVHAAAAGEAVFSPPIASRLVRRLRLRVDVPRGPRLTTRELEVLELLARGWDNTRIAAALSVSRGTVKHHISSIFAKLKVDNRIQAAVRAVQQGLLGP
jgi:DNA-binding NarL/FixJ family response regulator